MAGIERFEDIQAWQEARVLVKMVYELCSGNRFAHDFGLRDQIQRAAVSIMNNIAEGFDCGSTTEFLRFLGIARRSTVEVQSLAYTALDLKYISQEQFEAVYAQAAKTKGLIGGFMQYLKTYKQTQTDVPRSKSPVSR